MFITNAFNVSSYNSVSDEMDYANGNVAGNENSINSSHSNEGEHAGDAQDSAASDSR